MRNLKRALSLALAAVMLIGMMVVGASAVSYNDFTDRDEIVNKDAVSMLTTLGVIDGKTDGSFDPEGTVRRDEMAKMISVIMNQGVDNNDLFSGVNSKLTDIGDNWAKGHINYCFTLGIIAGRGDGRFDPAANVTGAEAAKMLLVAAGYDPSIEGFVGTDWAINTNAKASALGIFRNFNKNVMLPLNRDDAALLIYNALDIEMIQKYENGYAIGYTDHRTILSAMYGVYKVEGVVVANEWAELDETDSDAALKAGKTTLDNVVLYSSTTANTTQGEGVAQSGQISFNVSTGVETLGKTVTLYIEKTTILSDSKVLGVSLKDSVNVVQTTTATQSTSKDYLKGTGLTVTADTEYYINYGYQANEKTALEVINDFWKGSTASKYNLNGVEVEIIDNNNDGDVDYVLFLRKTLSCVSRYNVKNEIVTFYVPDYDANGKLDGTSSTKSVEFGDVIFADEVTTDDLILYVEYGGRTYISTPEIVTGTMSRVVRDKYNELYVTIEGETYKQSYILDAISPVDVDIEHFEINSAKADIGFSTKYDFILDSTGEYIVAYRPAEETVINYALVLDSAWTQNALDVKGQLEILKADGTEGTYYINWSASKKNAFGNSSTALEAYLGTRDVQTVNNTLGAAAGTVITYSLSDDDVLTIKSVLGLNKLKNDGEFTAVDGNQKPSVGTGDIAYIEKNAAAETGKVNGDDTTTPNLQYTLKAPYENGNGYLTVTVKETDKIYAVDKNTVAFYYDVVEADDLLQGGRYYGTTYKAGDVFYGVLTGWDNMSDVDKDVKAQIYPVLKKTETKTWETTKLAEVVLFNGKTSSSTSNWLLVLDANAVTSKILELNVVFEDGTTKAIEVSRDNYDTEFDLADGYAYMVAYTYSVNSDGTYELNLNSRTAATEAVLLKNGTLDVSNNGENDYAYAGIVYPTLVSKSNIWDVTDMDAAGDDAAKGTFVVGTKKNAVIITNNDNKVLQTAWIWDIDEVIVPTENDEYYLTIDTIVAGENATTDVTATLWQDVGKDDDIDNDQKVPGKTVSYTYGVEILSGNGQWVDSGISKTGKVTTGTDDAAGQVTVNLNFDSDHSTNAYRITVSFSNSDIGTVTAVKAGS